MKASEILKMDSTGFMTVGINALNKLINTLAKYKNDNDALIKQQQHLTASLDMAQAMISTLESENKELKNTAFRSRIVTSIEMDV